MKLAPLAPLALSLLLAAPAAAVPRAPAERAQRFGVYHWGADYSAHPVCSDCPDRLSWGADRVAEAGSRTIRVYFGANDSAYGVNPESNVDDDHYLVRVVAGAGYPGFSSETAYDRLFGDPRFSTYLLTVYTPADRRNAWASSEQPGGSTYSLEEYGLERRQIARLGEYLLRHYPGKTFILLNWEGDHAIGDRAVGDRAGLWEAFIAWIQSRADGVRDARRQFPGQEDRLLSGLEFNLVKRNGAWCGSTGEIANRCLIDYVAPRVDVDYYSYSAWETLNVKMGDPEADLKSALRTSLGFALERVREGRPEVTPAHFILGEVGFPRTAPRYGECRAAGHLREMISAVEGRGAFPVSYVIFWQAVDNNLASNPTDWATYGLFRGHDGRLGLLGATFRDLLGGKRVTLPTRCPKIQPCPEDPFNSCGVVNAATGEAVFEPGSFVSIAGNRFSRQGNVVSLAQNGRRFRIDESSGLIRSQSPSRLELVLPADLAPGTAILYVTNQQGLDSNAQILQIRRRVIR